MKVRYLLCIAISMCLILSLGVVSYAFDDIAGHWAEDDINLMYQKGLINGKSSNIFAPDNTLTKGELITMINRMFALDRYMESNKAKGQWYESEIDKAYYYQYTDLSEEEYENPVTRLEFVKMLYKLVGENVYFPYGDFGWRFNDLDSCSYEKIEMIYYMWAHGYISGTSETTFDPYGYVTRAQMVKLFSNIMPNRVATQSDLNNLLDWDNIVVVGDNLTIEGKNLGNVIVSAGVTNIVFKDCEIWSMKMGAEGAFEVKDTSITELSITPHKVNQPSVDIDNLSTIGVMFIPKEILETYYQDENIGEIEYFTSDSFDYIKEDVSGNYNLINDQYVKSDNGEYEGIFYVEDLLSIKSDRNYVMQKDLDFHLDSSYNNPNDTSFGDYNNDGVIEGIKNELLGDIDGINTGFNTVLYDTDYVGHFDGNNHEISNLYINDYNSKGLINAGLFYSIGSLGCVDNLTVNSVNIYLSLIQSYEKDMYYGYKPGVINAGIIATFNDGIIDNCNTNGKIDVYFDGSNLVETSISIGGVTSYNSGLIKNTSVDVDIEYAHSKREIGDDIDKLFFNIYADTGGIAGGNNDRLINCISNGKIVLDEDVYNVGGVCGINYVSGMNNTGNVENCISNMLFDLKNPADNINKCFGESVGSEY